MGAVEGLGLRLARADDAAAIVALLAEDTLGGHGDSTDGAQLPLYRAALERILSTQGNAMYVAEIGGVVIGTFQLTFIPGLRGAGKLRAVIETVQVAESQRSKGIGAAMIEHAMRLAREGGAAAVELSSNRARVNAHRFYRRLGFAQSHVGFKLKF